MKRVYAFCILLLIARLSFSLPPNSLVCNSQGGVASCNRQFVCQTDSVMLTLAGYMGFIQWQSSPAFQNNWTNIVGAVADTVVVFVSGATDFRAMVVDTPCVADSSTIVSVSSYPLNSVYCPRNVQFAPGSYIIGMDNNTQSLVSPFNIAAYGLINALLQNYIPVHRIIKQGKGKDGIDITANVNRVFPSAQGPLVLDFRAGPFIIDSAFAALAAPIISAFGNNVAVYSLNTSVTAEVRFTLTFAPKILVLANGGYQNIHIGILNSAGIPPANYDVGFASQVTDSNFCYTFASEAHWMGADTLETSAIHAFLNSGGNFLTQCHGIDTYENAELLQTNAGMLISNSSAPNIYHESESPFGQIHGLINPSPMGTVVSWTDNGFGYRNGLRSVVEKINGRLQATEFKHTLQTQPGGFSFYLGGHDYGNSSNILDINGVRMYLNAVFVPSTRSNLCNFLFNTDVRLDTIMPPSPYCEGSVFTISFIASNNGPGMGVNVFVNAQLPPALSYISHYSDNGSYDPFTGIWTIGNMGYGTTDTLTISCVISIPGFINFAAYISTLSYGNQTSNDTVNFAFPVVPAATTPVAGPDQSICADSSVLSGNTPGVGTGQWVVISGPGVLANPASPTTTVSNLGIGANIFTWEISNGACPPYRDTVVIYVDPFPTPSNAGGDQTICSTTWTLSGNTPLAGTGQWIVLSGTGILANPALPGTGVSNLSQGINLFEWLITSGTCPPSRDTVLIYLDSPPTIANAGPDQNICADSSVLTANMPTTGNGQWYVISGPGVLTSPYSPASPVTNLAVGTNTFVWTITNGVCPVSADTVEIYVDAMPTVSNAGSDTVICSSSFMLNGNIPLVGNGYWSLISGQGNIVSPASPNSVVTGLGVGTNTFLWNISNGACPPSGDTVIIMVTPMPTSANAGSDQNTCSGNFTLNGNTPLTGTGSWFLVAGSATILSPNSPSSSVTGLSPGINLFEWVISNGVCSSSRDTVMIFVDESPTVSDAGRDHTICDSSFVLVGNIPLIGAGYWSLVNGSGFIQNPSSPVTQVTQLGFGANIFRWTITNGTCPSTYDEIMISRSTVVSGANAGPDQVIGSSSTRMNADAPVNGTGLWTLVSGYGVLSNPADPLSNVTLIAPGSNVFRWMVINGYCEPNTDDVIITREDLIVPDGFSPNGDGINELFVIQGLDLVSPARLEIYNRWGNSIFRSGEYMNNWNGTNHSGEEVAEDTYFYILILADGSSVKGSVYLKRK